MRWMAAIVLVCAAAGAQDAGKRPAFEVATVRPVDLNARSAPVGFLSQPGGRVEIGYATVKMLAYYAFDVQMTHVVGGPDWAGSERYNVMAMPPAESESRTAKSPPLKATPSDEQRKMIEALLVERFGFKFHREMREMPVYLLERGSGKLALQTPKDPDADSRSAIVSYGGGIVSGEAFGTNVTMDFLAGRLSDSMDRPVVNKTGLAGHYDFVLEPADPENTDYNLAAIGAMNRLGLKLRPGKGMVEMIVIDSVTRPTEN